MFTYLAALFAVAGLIQTGTYATPAQHAALRDKLVRTAGLHHVPLSRGLEKGELGSGLQTGLGCKLPFAKIQVLIWTPKLECIPCCFVCHKEIKTSYG